MKKLEELIMEHMTDPSWYCQQGQVEAEEESPQLVAFEELLKKLEESNKKNDKKPS